MKAKNWLALLSSGMFAASIAAQPRPYQLCRTLDTSNQQVIGTNYRYPPKPEQRVPIDWSIPVCTLPDPLLYCPVMYGDCERDPRQDTCGEGPDSWDDRFVLRSSQIDQQTWPLYEPWPPNAAVLSLIALAYVGTYDMYRTWPYGSRPAQFLETRVGRGHGTRNLQSCHTMAHLLGFFNGVWNTKKEAERSLEVMKQQNFLGPDWRGAPIRYELFYNQSCKSVAGGACLQDVAEVFRQRSAEIDGLLDRRWE